MKSSTIAILAITFGTMALYSCSTMWAHKNMINSLPKEIQEWEKLAKDGDTVAMHKLIYFYDENCCEILEVEEVISAEGEDITDEVLMEQDNLNTELNQFYNERLDYWLNKGVSINDPVAISIKGMRLYYTDEETAVRYLAQAAQMGNGSAALLCGSAYFNLGEGREAIKYLTMADELGVPSAGWHLAMCYAGNAGVEQDLDRAMQYLVKSGLRDYPEAVLELKRIDPQNPIWQQKADSLHLDMPDFEIIPNEK